MFAQNRNEKPPSLPRNWPHPLPEDLEENPKRLIKIGEAQEYSFCNNFVKTSKYEVWNFLPKFLLEEFNPATKVANCYFLLISALQCIPQISNTGGYPTTMIPLLFVVFVDAIFQIFEDIARHKADREANASKSLRYNDSRKSFVECSWFEIEVGDIIKINTREMIPADVIILSVAEKYSPPQGLCYVETKSLDGETNLKIRNAMPNTYTKITTETDFRDVKGDVEMEHPNKIIASFNGVMDIYDWGREAVQLNNILLRGCVLRNTDWVLGLVVNTGHDTKIMMSSSETRQKSSYLETQASIEIQKIIVLLSVVCFAGATGLSIWNQENDVKNIWYLDWNPEPIGYWFIKFFYFFLLHASFIPVSLYVSMSVIRYFQAYFMNLDRDMYYDKTDTPALVRTMTLNEELGQISHIFSDKTGTLTCNVMDFRKMSIAGVSYGQGITEIGKAAAKLHGTEIPTSVLEGEARAKANAKPHVSFYCPLFEKHLAESREQRTKIHDFFRLLAICHDVIPERVGDEIKLSASSPDDEALVCAASYFGFEFVDRRESVCVINSHRNETPSGQQLADSSDKKSTLEEIEVLESIPFTSKRKRMSVIIRDADYKIRILSKGADTVMMERLRSGQNELLSTTNEHMRQFAVEGLRCLIIGQAEIAETTYRDWSVKYRAAKTDLNEIEKRKKNEPNKIEELEDYIEKNFKIMGATAIEDRLQDGVPECIAQLAASGINIWVLTGDKEETAINIAVACNLVLPPKFMEHIIVNKHTAPTEDKLKELFKTHITRFDTDQHTLGSSMKPRALIVDGPTLITIMRDTRDDGCRDCLLDLSQRCKAVVCCRVSPDQKREMVNLIKTGIEGVRTLAIGDGANDVAMIQEAHIGVGIRGEEGLQAVNSSDYAIAQFRYLSMLVLKHGRYNYIRMCTLICYMFYKNILMSMCHFWFNFNNSFSGQKYFTEGAIQMFNLLYTSLPILLLGTYDMDIKPETVFKHPQIFMSCIQNEYFKSTTFWGWIIWAFVESILLSVVPMYTLHSSDPSNGNLNSFWEAGATCFTVVILVINFKIFFIQSRYHWIHFAVILFSISLWFASAFFINSFTFFDFDWYNMFDTLVANPSYWLTVLMLTVGIVGKDLYLTALERTFNYSPVHVLQEMEMLSTPRGFHLSSVGVENNEVMAFDDKVNNGVEMSEIRSAQSTKQQIPQNK